MGAALRALAAGFARAAATAPAAAARVLGFALPPRRPGSSGGSPQGRETAWIPCADALRAHVRVRFCVVLLGLAGMAAEDPRLPAEDWIVKQLLGGGCPWFWSYRSFLPPLLAVFFSFPPTGEISLATAEKTLYCCQGSSQAVVNVQVTL